MSRTSSAVKDRYNAKAYDRITVRLPKGMKEQLQSACQVSGMSVNSVFVMAATEFISLRQAVSKEGRF